MTIDVLVDMRCGLCRRTARVLHALDWRRVLRFHNFHDPGVREKFAPYLSLEELDRQMHIVLPPTPHGQRPLLGGFSALRHLTSQLPLLWPLAPILYIPGISHLGQMTYSWTAQHRTKT